MRGLADKHPSIGDVRGLGLIAGIEVVKDRASKEKFSESGPELQALNEGLRKRGLLTRAGTIINLCPPLCISADEVQQIVDIVDGALSDMEKVAGMA